MIRNAFIIGSLAWLISACQTVRSYETASSNPEATTTVSSNSQVTTPVRTEAPEPRAPETPRRELAQGSSTAYGTVDAGIFPPEAKPGQCYEKLKLPAVTELREEKVVVVPEQKEVSYTEPEYDFMDKEVIIKEATEEVTTVPATYKTVYNKVMIKPAETKRVITPPQYEWIQKRVLVKPATKVWKVGRGAIEKFDAEKGQIMCLVDVPAVYDTVRTKVEVVPEKVETIVVPAKYRTVAQEVIDQPMKVIRTQVPAVTKKIKVKTLIKEPQRVVNIVPAKFKKVMKEHVLKEESSQWAQVLCQTNATPDIVKQIQNSLRAEGHYTGKVHGKLDEKTMLAVKAYQKANRLPLSYGSIPMVLVEQFVDQDTGIQYAH